MAETRCYLVIDAAAPRTLPQWQLLISGLKLKPMAAAIVDKARGSSYNDVNINKFSIDKRYILGDFEMREEERDDLLAVLEAERVTQGVPDGLSTRETFRRVMLEEVKDVAVEAGFPALAPLLDVLIIGFGQRLNAINEAHDWVHDPVRVANWES